MLSARSLNPSNNPPPVNRCSVPLLDWTGDKLTELIHNQAQIHPTKMLCEGAGKTESAKVLDEFLWGKEATQDPVPHLTQNPILRLGPAFSPECSAFAFLALAISASIIACVTNHRSGFGSVLPA